MSLAFSVPHAICLILVHIIFLSLAESEFPELATNVNKNTSLWKGRSKRSLFDELPLELKMTIKYMTGEKVDLKFMKTPQFLANEHLPLITSNVFFNVMEDIGQFVFYHDTSKCSAVVYFEKFKTLYGVIGMNHYIQDLPFNFNQYGTYLSGVVGQPYVKEHGHPFHHIDPSLIHPAPSDTDAWNDFLRPSTHDSHQNHKRPLVSDPVVNVKRLRINQDYNKENEEETTMKQYQINSIDGYQRNPKFQEYFLETLVFVTRDIAEIFEKFFGKGEYIQWIGRYLIIYFNSVDMMIQKVRLPHMTIHINIAKIVIEDELRSFSDFIDNENLQFTHVADKLPHYLSSHPNEYPPDSFDHIFIYTSRSIFDGIVQVEGLTRHGLDVYATRKNNYFYDAVPITIVRFRYYYADYPVAVHEIGRIFGMKIEPRERSMGAKGQCCGVMQREGPKCKDCLKWSDDSRIQMETFFRTDKNRCFLLNKPRSLHTFGVGSFVTANSQCRCFGYHSAIKGSTGYVMKSVGLKGCTKPLQCQKSDILQDHESTILPFDGTPCAAKKVCWARKCQPVTITKKP